MFSMADAFCRVAYWNHARYPRTYNNELQLKLLFEEYKELFIAKEEQNLVEAIDGVCDICYVALGGLWKLGHYFDIRKAAEVYLKTLNALDGTSVSMYTRMELMLAAAEHMEDTDLELLQYDAIAHALLIAEYSLGVPQGVTISCLEAVCNSNDTKEVKATPADQKANVVKGSGYVAPTEALRTLLAEYL